MTDMEEIGNEVQLKWNVFNWGPPQKVHLVLFDCTFIALYIAICSAVDITDCDSQCNAARGVWRRQQQQGHPPESLMDHTKLINFLMPTRSSDDCRLFRLQGSKMVLLEAPLNCARTRLPPRKQLLAHKVLR